MKIFLDSNILLRLYLKDDERQFEYCKKLISEIEQGKFRAYVSGIVFLEISYVLKSVYNIPFEDIVKILKSILEIRGLTIVEKTATKKAFEYYKKYKIKFTDCLIASQLPQNSILVTFDADFSKISGIAVKRPQDFELV